jgi:hypothetical protein
MGCERLGATVGSADLDAHVVEVDGRVEVPRSVVHPSVADASISPVGPASPPPIVDASEALVELSCRPRLRGFEDGRPRRERC